MDRRHFLSTSLLAAAAPALGNGALAASSAAPLGEPVAEATATSATAAGVTFSAERFRSLVGSGFQFSGEGWCGTLQLTGVSSRAIDERVEQFSTVFEVDAAATPPMSGLYDVAHPELGHFTLRIDGQHDSNRRQASFALLRN